MQLLHGFLAVLAVGLAFLGSGPLLAVGTEDTALEAPAGLSAYDAAKEAIYLKNYAAAKPILVQLTLDEPSNADAWNLLGFSNRKMGIMDAAAVAYETALKINPQHLGALEYQGEMYIETGMIDKATANLDALKLLCGDCDEYKDLAKALDAAS